MFVFSGEAEVLMVSSVARDWPVAIRPRAYEIGLRVESTPEQAGFNTLFRGETAKNGCTKRRW